eukprot:CAMPEP_0202686728 /NCGR_PEP_ID=MMETSP1385-20130828/2490_1 /ASSEMBLY_ACC=CAM_ASM_000861 /TAXON_ID=933848 /ORGANISM="Elphidium margaritaceum" /LENGTH=719 /DNA_ID=CAMNT_0049341373 /DNA_START=21 /DNA_END=2180 /DNA_ORIENTATION=+
MNHGTYTWQITNQESLQRLMNAKVGESFESEVFEIGKLKWVILIFPNGWNKSNKGCFNICIKLLTMSSKWKQLILCRTIQCVDTQSSCTSIASYYKNGDTMCWKERTLLLSELQCLQATLDALTFRVSIVILKIICRKDDEVLYPNLMQYGMEAQQSIVWKIESGTLNKFRMAYHSKSFESGKHSDGMWCLRCYPNGISPKDESYLGLYLTLCGLPAHISKLKVLYTFRCKEFKSLKHSRIKNFSYEEKSSWGVSRFFEQVKLHRVRALTIYADITVMTEYGEDGREILPQLSLLNHGSQTMSGSNTRTCTALTARTLHPTNDEDTEEEKVNHVDGEFDSSVHCVEPSSNQSSTLEHLKGQTGAATAVTAAVDTRASLPDVEAMMTNMKQEIQSDIQQLQMAYNVKLNSLCSIVEQIQVNNDKLTAQTMKMMRTVNDVCSAMQKERVHTPQQQRQQQQQQQQLNELHRVESLRCELESLKSLVLQQTNRTLRLSNDHAESQSHASGLSASEDEQSAHAAEEEQKRNSRTRTGAAWVTQWLTHEVGLAQYAELFILSGFDDMHIVQEMTLHDLQSIGIEKLGHKKKILLHIRKMAAALTPPTTRTREHMTHHSMMMPHLQDFSLMNRPKIKLDRDRDRKRTHQSWNANAYDAAAVHAMPISIRTESGGERRSTKKRGSGWSQSVHLNSRQHEMHLHHKIYSDATVKEHATSHSTSQNINI